jgi:hypothetical protein
VGLKKPLTLEEQIEIRKKLEEVLAETKEILREES